MSAQAGAGFRDQGLLPRDAPRGLLYGLASSVPIGLALVAGPRSARLQSLYRVRAATAKPTSAAYEVLLRIPLGTALPEELAFRGALLGRLTRGHRPAVACAISSLLFGLSHVPPSLSRIEGGTHTGLQKAAWVGSSVGVTSVAGFALAWLRLYSRSLVAPWIAHTAANSVGYVAARFMARRESPVRFSRPGSTL